ncbi:hypothetical protein CEP54_008667 [Fusarium duplospermum]|uniref:Heterokaryon incompatibility domain-containing protein n=1 Tax=Fusarium duplospermum TaxID=1325734 RepID=A0A428PUQ7_9HYPO|nr:hypothetical protein CEP54_008667 [Fusarium duplospermum]
MAESSNSKESPPDIYKPLDKSTREIRLFEILPSKDTNATIEIRLFRRRLEDVLGQFIPFSYVWGDPTDTKPIMVNGISTPSTRNLADFLKQTRTLLPDILIKGSWDKPAIFWADAICINQQDTEERNHQVQLLKSIYSSAPLALAWLGHYRDAHLAVSLAESLGPPCSHKSKSISPKVDCNSWMYAYPHLWDVSEDRNAYWEAFQALAQSPYWTRTWTFQEMVLPINALLMCGSSLVEWQSFQAVREFLMALLATVTSCELPARGHHRTLLSAIGSFMGGSAGPINGICNVRLVIAATSDYPDLTLVPLQAKHQATDPRDKVYGLLGVMKTRLEADYTKDTAQVYSEFVSAWIDEVKDLNFLIYSHHYDRIARHGQNPLPSWAPDWEAISREENNTEDYPNRAHFMVRFLNLFEGSEQLPLGNAHVRDGLSTLAAPGVVVGKVEEVYPPWSSDMSDAYFAIDVFQLAVKCRSCSGPPLGPGLHVLQVLFRTIIPHDKLRNMLQNEEISHQGSLALYFLVGLLAWVVDSEGPDWHRVAEIFLPPLGIPLGPDFSRAWKEEIFEGYSPESNMPDWEDAAAAMEWAWENAREDVEVLRNRTRDRLEPPLKVVTNNGYLGVAAAAQAGDLVVVLAGCRVPVLLRRSGSYCEHVGSCFVVGLMEGEAKQMVDRGEAKIETFEIR